MMALKLLAKVTWGLRLLLYLITYLACAREVSVTQSQETLRSWSKTMAVIFLERWEGVAIDNENFITVNFVDLHY